MLTNTGSLTGGDDGIFAQTITTLTNTGSITGTSYDGILAESLGTLINDGTIDSGMIPKIEACLSTLQRGVRKVHIIDGRLRHSLLLEIYTTSGVGTELTHERRSASPL